jgi:hypothetical protein
MFNRILKSPSLLIISFLLVQGCAAQPKETIQRRGDVVAEGTGQLSFRAPGPGLVSVYDVNADSIIHSSAVDAGSVISINPAAMNITVTDAARAGTQVVHTGINKSHRYEMWYIPRTYRAMDSATTQPLR